jgi:hypothetical protein
MVDAQIVMVDYHKKLYFVDQNEIDRENHCRTNITAEKGIYAFLFTIIIMSN